MRKILFALFLITILIIPLAVSAQSAISIESLQIEFWPEYDRTDMLVLYNIQLPEDTILPVELSFKIPASAGEPNAVAIAIDNRWMTVEYSTEVQGDWNTISFVTDSTAAHLEYYDPGLMKDGVARNFVYTWLGEYAVNFLQLRIQEPVNASGMKLSLPSSDSIIEDGLNYYYSEFSNLVVGESKTLSLSYNKSSDELSYQPGAQPVANQDEGSSPINLQFNPQVILGIFAVALIGFGLYNNFKPQKTSRRGSRRRKSTRPTTQKRKQTGGKIFCHQCGNAGTQNDKFCRECGGKLRQ